jgi:uncharacterized protein YqfB (UPF0267 family)
MDIDTMSTEKRAALMRKGACFICEETGHMAKDHKEHMKKKKANIRETIIVTSPSSSKTKSVNEIHALLQALSLTEIKELLALQSTNQEQKYNADF